MINKELRDRCNVLIVSPENAKRTGKTIKEIFYDKKLRRKLIRNGLLHDKGSLNELISEQHAEIIYREILSKKINSLAIDKKNELL